MISIRILRTTTIHRPSLGTMEMSFLFAHLRRFSGIYLYECLSIFPPLGRTVILEVKGLLIACLLPADRSTEDSEARRIQRQWSVVICPLMDDSYSLPAL